VGEGIYGVGMILWFLVGGLGGRCVGWDCLGVGLNGGGSRVFLCWDVGVVCLCLGFFVWFFLLCYTVGNCYEGVV